MTQPNPTAQQRARRRPDRRFAVVAVLAVLAIVLGLFGPSAWARVTGNSAGANASAKDRIEAHPPPTLFPAAAVATTATDVAAQQKKAAALLRPWLSAHGTSRDDKAFVAWLEKVFPPPPASLSTEMPKVVALSKTRTPAGVAAATWLESYGKKDVWKLFAHDQREVLAATTGKDRKTEVKSALKMSKQVADDLGARYGSSAPYVRMPSLRTDHKVIPGQKCPCSYPSRHATASASARTVLGTLMPDRAGQYRAMEAQVDYSRVYMAGHFPTDIRAGALLGDVVGDYLLVTRNGLDPQRLATG